MPNKETVSYAQAGMSAEGVIDTRLSTGVLGCQFGICGRFLLKPPRSVLTSRAWPGVFVRRGAGVGHWHGAHFQKTVAFTFLHRKPLFFRNDKPLPFTFL